MLLENRTTAARILAVQKDNAVRLDALGKSINQNNESHVKEMEEIKERLDALESQLAVSRKSLKNRMNQTGNTDCEDHPILNLVKNLEEKFEAQDKFNRQNNIIIRGSTFKVSDLRSRTTKFLADHFNYSGQIFNVKPLGRESNNRNNINIVAVTLESLEAKLNILRKRKVLLNRKKVIVHADLTVRERKCAYELKKFARGLQPEGIGVKFGYQKVFVNNNWYTWDRTKHSVAQWHFGQKSNDPRPYITPCVS